MSIGYIIVLNIRENPSWLDDPHEFSFQLIWMTFKQ